MATEDLPFTEEQDNEEDESAGEYSDGSQEYSEEIEPHRQTEGGAEQDGEQDGDSDRDSAYEDDSELEEWELWHAAYDQAGRTYFYHEETGEVTWTRPVCMGPDTGNGMENQRSNFSYFEYNICLLLS
jgi:hypothetical protein